MIIKHTIRDLISKIDWEAFFIEWKFHKRFASVANLQGCDVVRASWLTDFEEKDRAKASKAMQLLKEAYRIIEQLDKDYEITTLHKSTPALPASLQELVAIEPTQVPYILMVAVADPEIDSLYENDEHNKKIVETVTKRLVDAAILASREQIDNSLHSFAIDPRTRKPELWKQLDDLLGFSKIGVSVSKDGNLLPMSAQCAIIM